MPLLLRPDYVTIYGWLDTSMGSFIQVKPPFRQKRGGAVQNKLSGLVEVIFFFLRG